jgi:hypothetical protein
MQFAGNDLCGFYVMHYMCNLINALSGSQVWPLGPSSKFNLLTVCSKACLNCVSPFSCVPDRTVTYTGADLFGDIWVPRRSFWFHYGPSHEQQRSPSSSIIKMLVFWKIYIPYCWIWTLCLCGCWTLCMLLSVWIFVSWWWCMFVQYIVSLYICCWRCVSHKISILL